MRGGPLSRIRGFYCFLSRYTEPKGPVYFSYAVVLFIWCLLVKSNLPSPVTYPVTYPFVAALFFNLGLRHYCETIGRKVEPLKLRSIVVRHSIVLGFCFWASFIIVRTVPDTLKYIMTPSLWSVLLYGAAISLIPGIIAGMTCYLGSKRIWEEDYKTPG